MHIQTIWAIALKDLRQFIRDRTLVMLMLLLPVLQLVLLAQATAKGVRDLPIGVLDFDRSMYSRAFTELLSAPETFEIVLYPATLAEGTYAIERQDIWALLIIPQDFATSLQDPRLRTTVRLIADGTNTIAANISIARVQQVVQRFTERYSAHFSIPDAGIRLESVMRYNPTMTSRPYTITAQLGMITYEIVLGVAALGLARERELGTLEQLMVTPVRRYELLLGKIIPPGIVGLIDFLVLTLILRYAFRIPIHGSYLLLLGGSLVFIIAEVIWGTMLSALTATQQQAILLIFIQAVVDMAFSGYLVPVQNMPASFAFIARFVPLHYYLNFVRGVVLRGAGWSDVGQNITAIAVLSFVMAVIATHMISQKLD